MRKSTIFVTSKNDVTMRSRIIGSDHVHVDPAEPPCSYTDEEMYRIVKERLQELEDGTAELIDGEVVLSEARERYGFEAKLVK